MAGEKFHMVPQDMRLVFSSMVSTITGGRDSFVVKLHSFPATSAGTVFFICHRYALALCHGLALPRLLITLYSNANDARGILCKYGFIDEYRYVVVASVLYGHETPGHPHR